MRFLASLLLVLSTLACGDSDDSDPVADAGPGVDAAPSPRFGESPIAFRVAEIRGSDGENLSDGARIIGAAYDGDPPVFHDEAMRAGTCRLMTFESQNCTPFCDGICRPNNVCDPFPTFESVGSVEVSGLKENVTINEFDGRYFPSEALPADLFDPGDRVELTVSGAGGLSLSADAPEPLDIDIGLALTLDDSQDTVLSWTPAGGGHRVNLVLRSSNAAHGLPLDAIIECDGPDTGELRVPKEMIERFPPAFGSTICASFDCPTSELSRYRVDEVSTGASVAELVVAAELSFPLIHGDAQ